MGRTPDEIMADFDIGCQGRADIDMHGILWEIINDILDTVDKAVTTGTMEVNKILIMEEINDYVANHYGDD